MLGLDPLAILIQFAALIASLSVHEAAHAWSADRLGDPTPRALGRLTLNPVAHVDPIGTLLLPLMGMLSPARFLIGWAKAVPVGTRNLGTNWRQKFMLIAAAGPASNIALAVLTALVYRIAFGSPFERSGLASQLVILIVDLNVVLALFNLVPIPPLDGGNVLAGLLTGSAAGTLDRIRPYGFLIVLGLAATGLLWTILGPAKESLVRILLSNG